MNDEATRVNSSEFRISYPRLREPVAVTVLGRVIGWWTPVGAPPAASEDTGSFIRPTGAQSATGTSSSATAQVAAPKGIGSADGSTAGMTQRERDKVLRRVATKGDTI